MKPDIYKIMVRAALLVLPPATLYAQSAGTRFVVPFQFTADGKVMPAGDYFVECLWWNFVAFHPSKPDSNLIIMTHRSPRTPQMLYLPNPSPELARHPPAQGPTQTGIPVSLASRCIAASHPRRLVPDASCAQRCSARARNRRMSHSRWAPRLLLNLFACDGFARPLQSHGENLDGMPL
jgi:hypothetical protein